MKYPLCVKGWEEYIGYGMDSWLRSCVYRFVEGLEVLKWVLVERIVWCYVMDLKMLDGCLREYEFY